MARSRYRPFMLTQTHIPGGEIAWRARNPEAGGVPIVMIHGAAGRKEIWLAVSRRLADRLADRPIVLLDLPGHGDSAGPGRASIADYADAVRSFCEAQSWPQVDLVGHSMGGAIAQVLAAEHPALVRRMVLIGTGPRLGVAPLLLQLLPDQPVEAFGLMRQFAFGAEAPPLIVEAAIEQMLAGDAQVAHDDFVACDNWRGDDGLAKITAPTLIVVGEEDHLATPRLNEKLLAIKDSRLEQLPRTGHMVPVEQDETLADLLAKHLGE